MRIEIKKDRNGGIHKVRNGGIRGKEPKIVDSGLRNGRMGGERGQRGREK